MTDDASLRARSGSARRSHRAEGAPTGPMGVQHPPESSFDSIFTRPSPVQAPERTPHGPARSARPGGGGGGPAHPTPPRTPDRRPGRSRLPIVAALVVLVLVIVAAAFGIDHLSSHGSDLPRVDATSPQPAPAAGGRAAGPTSPAKAVVHTGADAKVKLGVSVDDLSDTGPFGRWLGRAPQYSVAFSPRYTWKQIADPSYLIDQWRGSKYRMVYSVAMLPKHDSASFKNGAKGAYDVYYRELAQRLVNGGQQDAIIRLGWEFNLGSSNWETSDPQAFIAYWRHVVTAMRSVPGQKFQFDWNPNIGDTTYDATLYYPGSAYVDYIGIDVYDISWEDDTYPYPASCDSDCKLARQQLVWQRVLYGTGGLAFWSQYARAKGKPMSLPEWGLWDRPDGHGGDDDPYFIKQMFAFIDDPQNNIAYQCYFDINVPGDGDHKLTTLTTSGAVFRKLFG